MSDAVVTLDLQPDGTDWCVVFVGGEECLPTGRSSVSLSVADAKQLIEVLTAAVERREAAVKGGWADA